MRKAILRVQANNAKSTSQTHPWVIQGLKVDGKRKRLFFTTKVDAEAELRKLGTRIKNEGNAGLSIPDDLRNMAAKWAKELEPYGKTLADAASFYIDHIQQMNRSCAFSTMKDAFILAKTSDGKSPRYLGDLRSRLGRFEEDFGKQLVASITTAQINAWLRSLRDVQPKTRNNFRRVLHAIFEFAVDEEYCTFNPVAKAARAKDIGSDPEALTATEATALLEAAGSDMVPAVAIGLFAGLRRSEIETLLWSDVMFSRGLIQVGRHCKGARKRFVKIEPNLAQWLAPFSSLTSGPVVEAFRYKLDALREAAKLTRWPNNALRHSYGSYHLAHFMDAKRTSLEMGHKDVSVTFDHYRELVLPEDAALYWQIAPKPKDDEQRSENIIAMPAAA